MVGFQERVEIIPAWFMRNLKLPTYVDLGPLNLTLAVAKRCRAFSWRVSIKRNHGFMRGAAPRMASLG